MFMSIMDDKYHNPTIQEDLINQKSCKTCNKKYE